MFDTDSIKITHEMIAIMSEIDEFKGAWRALGKIAPERLNQLRKVATIESVGSSTRIEGSKLSDREVETLLSRLESKSFTSRDEEEVAGYAAVMEIIFNAYETIPFTENYLKQLHSILLQYSSKDQRHRGDYKKLSNSVEAIGVDGKSIGVVFETTSPFDTPREMEALYAFVNKAFTGKMIHPLVIVAIFIVVFLAIHPFQDGNGRLSRILTTLLLLKSGYTYVPYSSMESIIEQNKESYYLALRRTQQSFKLADTDWSPWLLFFLQSLQKQKRRLEQKVEKEKIMRASLPELSLKIIDLVHEHGQISVADIVNATEANRNTIKKYLGKLVVSGYLVRGGKAKGTWYSLA
ncbi:MAG: Fic family protein [Candidatus Midichloriaceae bacterium]|jgi:Fic family protein|nr:Fic family protein [Candidatus Midichloriaceae bacterium]